MVLAKQLLSVEGISDTTGFFSDDLDLRPGGITRLMMRSEESQNKQNFLPDFSDLLSKNTFSFRAFPIDSNYQIINVTARDSLKSGFDFYLHFKKKENNWQLSDVRRLEFATVAELWMVNYTDQQVDSIVNSSDSQKIIRSREQFEAIKDLYGLTMNFDDTIISYFNSNRASFNRLSDSFHAFRKGKGRNIIVAAGTLTSLNKDNLIITELSELTESTNDIVAFYILNTHHGAVGYLHVQNEYQVSEIMQKKNLFFIREIGNGWYLFKGSGK